MPSTAACAAGSSCERYSVRATAAYSVSLTSVDLPEPDTPVTQVNRPTGNATLTLFRLLPLAPSTRISCSAPRVARCSASRAARRTAASLGGKREAFLGSHGMVSSTGSHGVRCAGRAMDFLPERYWPVSDAAVALMSS